MPSDLISWERGPSAITLNRRSSLIDNARRGAQVSYGVLTYRGRNFRITYQGTEVLLKEGKLPVGYLDVVIVGVSPWISRQYFPKNYTEGDSNGPDCYSTDGQKPDAGVPNRQNPTCGDCKHSQWGSRMTDNNKKAKNCQDNKRLAIVPLSDIANEMFGGPILLRLPPMTIPKFSQYGEFLARKGASFEYVATRISFDPDVAYPRLDFNAQGFLSDEQLVQVVGADGNGGICVHPQIGRILGTSDTPSPAQQEPQGPPPSPPPQEEPDEEEPDEPEPPAAKRTRKAAAPPPPTETIMPTPTGMEESLNRLFGRKSA